MANDLTEMKSSAMKASAESRRFWKAGDVGLEDLLIAIAAYGKPRVSHQGSGWYSVIEMYVGDKGVEFNIKSEFGHVTPLAAVKECAERLDAALVTLGA